ncbi:MAG: Putative oxidoreductase [Anaerolinea thermophila]|uniref:Putative oxidoreductase n=1 Tax=Anaerolinea thermophila TaxID=167964 RepID=A0A101FXD0_9CHLR|nr:MAG: Putative oxidoreductase [Anaerolinea thermophila]
MMKPMNKKPYDVIVIGAGSVGVPAAFFLGKAGLQVLVLESNPSIGQGSNKSAIGGIRATHSDSSKAWLCQRSIEIFSTWKQTYGDEIEWKKGGYVYAIYREQDRANLQSLLVKQKSWGMNIDWLDKGDLLSVVPDLNPDKLLGGTYSPNDGHTSPLLSLYAFFKHAASMGVDFHFSEPVQELVMQSGKVIGVKTNRETYHADWVINAAGAWAGKIAQLAHIDLPILPESHEAGITEPVRTFLDPLIVDIRPMGNTANFYFYQHATGQVLFCYTPDPPIQGYDTRVTSEFLPVAAKRLTSLLPRLQNIRVRRTWRGLYPMTPDGAPFLGPVNEAPGLLLAAGMCGQGFMLGPGTGELLTNTITGSLSREQSDILENLSLYRQISHVEMLK